MIQIEKTLSNFIKEQFPDFYKEEGPDFIAFMTNYFEFLEKEGYPINLSRNLPEIRDIDSTIEPFLQYFSAKYMRNIPKQVVGNKREFVKRIKDLYRSKGSDNGFKLLFRLLYDEDIDIYLPKNDILKASDGVWVEENIIELTKSSINKDMVDKLIEGFDSGATAFVSDYREFFVKGRTVNIAVLDNISGDFQADEFLLWEGIDRTLAPRILGSPVEFEVVSSISGIPINTILESDDLDTRGEGIKNIVTNTFVGSGVINFTLENGGTGYSLDADISITSGSNTSGQDANFVIQSITDTSLFLNNNLVIEPYSNVQLDSTTFAFDVSDDSSLSTANLETMIDVGLVIEFIEVGTIERIRTINPGSNYDGDVNVSVIDPYTSRLNVSENGGIRGKNATVLGLGEIGNVVTDLRIIDSGFGYNDSDIIRFQGIDDPNLFLNARIIKGGLGKKEGRWFTNRGFLNSDKYLHDNHFYQEYSYEIFSKNSIDKYIDVLKQTVHIAGNEVFGKYIIFNDKKRSPEIIESSLIQT